MPTGIVRERQAVPQVRRSCRSAHNLCADLQSVRSDNVSLLSVLILQQSQTRRANRIVLNRHHSRFDPVLAALEINDAELLFVTATNATRRRATVVLRPPVFLRISTRLFSGFVFVISSVRRDCDVSRRRRQRSKCLHWHKRITFPSLSLEQSDHQSCAQSGRQLSACRLNAVLPRVSPERSAEYTNRNFLCNKFFLC